MKLRKYQHYDNFSYNVRQKRSSFIIPAAGVFKRQKSNSVGAKEALPPPGALSRHTQCRAKRSAGAKSRGSARARAMTLNRPCCCCFSKHSLVISTKQRQSRARARNPLLCRALSARRVLPPHYPEEPIIAFYSL